MADAIWPVGLPQAPRVARYNQVDQSRVVRTAMDVGPAKVRRRATAAIETCEIELRLTRSQVATLKAFFRDTVHAGAVPFEWVHHETGNAIDYRFTEPPRFAPSAPRQDGTEFWTASFPLEAMPGTEVTTPAPPPPPPPPNPEDPLLVMEGGGPGAGPIDPGDVVSYDDVGDFAPEPDDSSFVFVGETSPESLDASSLISIADDTTAASYATGGGASTPAPPGGEF